MNKIAPRDEAAIAPAPNDLNALMRVALEQNSVDALERLVALQERVEERNATRAFHAAMAEFQQRCPPIPKRHRSQPSREGAKFTYSYATLDDIARIVNPILAELGLSYTWDTEPIESVLRKTTCTLHHRDGHSRSSSFTGPKDSGSMNAIQQGGSGDTYGRRYSLIYVLGLTTTDDCPSSSEHQVANLKAKAEEMGRNIPRFLDYFSKTMGCETPLKTVEEIPAAWFERAIKTLEWRGK